ncbi:bZIP transcription factor [Pseudoalteromonas sp. R3]|uniref:bZIP transcription factor n=1 Tax=Pseudoalteromonas sp. R3 TaxID=1709477 RepID=UPI0006B4AD4C|nr:bZIP transcription factor [Pseudoalteromonas sp. R3]AZZ98739.1 hypothetical protein ELR70_17535 [Pseudoalteromonas sp. R3]
MTSNFEHGSDKGEANSVGRAAGDISNNDNLFAAEPTNAIKWMDFQTARYASVTTHMKISKSGKKKLIDTVTECAPTYCTVGIDRQEGMFVSRLARLWSRTLVNTDIYNDLLTGLSSKISLTGSTLQQKVAQLEEENQQLRKQVNELTNQLSADSLRQENISRIKKTKESYLKDMSQSSGFGKLLDCTRQHINGLRRQGKLLAVNGKNGNYYPEWQVNSSGEVYPCIESIVGVFGKDDPWTAIQFFHTPSDLLSNSTPREWMSDGGDEELLLTAAKLFTEQTL